MFNQYPYLNLNDLNLDYLLNEIKSMYNDVTNFVSINAIKYADPIQWNITSQYEKNTVVIDPLTGTAYISVAAVPSGVALTRTEYWTVVFDLGSFVVRAAKNFTTRYEDETTLTATFSTTAGQWLVWGDTLYIANVNITAGDSYVVGGNISRITVEELKNAIINIIGSLDDLTTTNKTSIVNAVNSVVTLIGALDDLTTTDTTSIVNAINSIVTAIGVVVNDLNSLTTTVNNRTVVNVKDYGAVGDGVTDDTAAFQAAVDSGFDVFVPMSSGEVYVLTDTININNFRQAIYAEPILRGLDNNIRGHIVSTATICFYTECMGVIFKNLCIIGNTTNTAITCQATSINDNADPRIENCSFQTFSCCVRNYGRGVCFINNAVVSCSCAIRNSYSFDGTGGTAMQQPTTGDRALRVINNRCHGMELLVDNVGGLLNGAIISENTLDIGGTIFACSGGGIINSIISNNVSTYTAGRAIISASGTTTFDYCIVANNVIKGVSGRLPQRAFYIGDNITSFTHNTIIGNVFDYITAEGIFIVPASSDNVIADNVITNVGQNNTSLAAVRFVGAVTNTIISGNKIEVASSVATSAIRIQSTVTNCIISRNITPSTLPLILGYTQGSPKSIIDGMATIADLSDAPTQSDFNNLLAALRDMKIIS